jgi:hypothetical protein
MADDFGHFGKGLEGYAHYYEATEGSGNKSGGGGGPGNKGPSNKGSGFRIFLVLIIIYTLLKIMVWFGGF